MSTPTNGVDVRRLTPARRPERISQATSVEQSRAMAEVQAAIFVAQQYPRNIETAIEEMRASCRRPELASRAFYRYKRGGSAISGASIHLARELARCFGNVHHGIAELSQDRDAAQSEMIAFAWDLQTNTRGSNTFIVPHFRDANGEQKPLIDVRDVYENNANMGARRLREQIFSVLPPWFVEEAKTLCSKTLEDGGGIPLQQRKANCLAMFGDIGVSKVQLEEKIGRAAPDWTAHDVAQFGVVFQSISRNEITIEDEFPPARVTGEDITDQASRPVQRAPRREPKVRAAEDAPPAAASDVPLEFDPTLEPGFGGPR